MATKRGEIMAKVVTTLCLAVVINIKEHTVVLIFIYGAR